MTTVHKRQNMQPHHWAHLSDCTECALRFAAMVQIQLDLEDLKLAKRPQAALKLFKDRGDASLFCPYLFVALNTSVWSDDAPDA
jgi:hypothetical protein